MHGLRTHTQTLKPRQTLKPVRRLSSSLVVLAWVVGMLMLGISPSLGQEVFEVDQELDFDAPEAWAMKYFTSLSQFSSVGAVGDLEAGGLDAGFEIIQVPHLDRQQRTVGFGGFKEENLNRTPVWGRLRLGVGLGSGWQLSVGWIPPLEVDGVEANLWSLAVEKRLLGKDPWALDLRVHGQTGEVKGDFTCEAGTDERFPPGSPDNVFGCEAPSQDEVALDYYGAELVGTYRLGGGPQLHLGIGVQRIDASFQVDALTFGFRDRTRLLTEGETVSFALGATWDIGQRIELGVEGLYVPLDIQRPGDISAQDESLAHLRALLRYRLR